MRMKIVNLISLRVISFQWNLLSNPIAIQVPIMFLLRHYRRRIIRVPM